MMGQAWHALMIVAAMMVINCSGGSGTASIDTIQEGTGPAFDVTQTGSLEGLIKTIVDAGKQSLFEVLPDTDVENEVIKNTLCSTKHYYESISTNQDAGGSEGLSINGFIQEDRVGSDGLSALVELNGKFDNVAMNYNEAVFGVTGDGKYSTSGDSQTGADDYCAGQSSGGLANGATVTETASGAFSLSGGIGGKISYQYSISQVGGGASATSSGSATFVSAGQETTCTLSAPAFGKTVVVACK